MELSLPKKATILASVTAFFLALIKFAAGIASGSMAVLSSAIDSLLDMAISLFNLYAVKISEMDEDGQFNYGRDKIEGLAALLEAIVIGITGIYIIVQSVSNIVGGKRLEMVDAAIWAMLFSTVVTAFLIWFLFSCWHKTQSMIIYSDLQHYKSDLFTNIGIIVSLVLIALSGFSAIDSVVSIVIAVFIIYNAKKVAGVGIIMLLDRAIDKPLLDRIENVLKNAPNILGYHYLRTRKSAHTYVVDVHLVFNEESSLRDAHDVSDYVEEEIASLDRSSKWFITVHLDPRDDSV
ncbi:MAG: cation diffusion facilitator family transporter [Helicobacteraceae bacterium]|jgi:cation diffusion facilitator family transporter|nr:cation diffusion facilitator family transporter [Helicobacteraceae bacterium]